LPLSCWREVLDADQVLRLVKGLPLQEVVPTVTAASSDRAARPVEPCCAVAQHADRPEWRRGFASPAFTIPLPDGQT
jgi:hypothetical protein